MIAATTLGKVEGREKDGYSLFAGIPFASPPVGERRFLPPEPHPGWHGVRDATRFGKASPQLPRMLGAALPGADLEWDEDCLFLNVVTPAVDDARRPVMVWIHGGAFVGGSGRTPWYNGASFARMHDTVIVTVNYRLGALGFLHLGGVDASLASSGLNGILDQVEALRWVRDNISAFGGDPDNVTIFGESAGGMSVGTLLGLPEAKGLFHKAILQSGACHHSLAAETAAELTGLFLAEAGTGDLDELRRLPVERILEVQGSLAARLETQPGSVRSPEGRPITLPLLPVVDGRALPRPPIDTVANGDAPRVPVMVGTNLDEFTLWTVLETELGEDRLLRRLTGFVPDPKEAVAAYSQARPDASPAELFTALMTDLTFRIPAIRLAESHARHQPATWMYLFTWRSTAFGGRLGSCHALEIPFVFNQLDAGGVAEFCGEGPPRDLAETMHAAWAAFARSSDPNHPGLPDWPVYETDRRLTIELGSERRILEDPAGDERELWDGIL